MGRTICSLPTRAWRHRNARRGAKPRLEGLEVRSLLSATGLDALIAQPAAMVVTPLATSAVSAPYWPSQVRTAYGLNQVYFGSVAGDGAGQTIAIVDAFGDPNIVSDLHTFDAATGLADTSVTVRNIGFSRGYDSGWAVEESLDVEWAHAIAPRANILVVNAASDSFTDLFNAVRYAATQTGVAAVSMSWGGSIGSYETYFDSYFTTSGVTFLAASGDSGAVVGSDYPADSPNVVSVGGTTLNLTNSTGNYGSEAAWNGSGGGYSLYESEPAYQRTVQASGVRTFPDVSMVADPSTGVLVYDSFMRGGGSGWYIVGGTSASTPMWAGIVAIGDEGRALSGKSALSSTQTLTTLYNLPSSAFHDVVSGNNSTGSQWFLAGYGYDMVTGRGTPVVPSIVAGFVSTATTSVRIASTGTTTSTVRLRTFLDGSSSLSATTATTNSAFLASVAVGLPTTTSAAPIATAITTNSPSPSVSLAPNSVTNATVGQGATPTGPLAGSLMSPWFATNWDSAIASGSAPAAPNPSGDGSAPSSTLAPEAPTADPTPPPAPDVAPEVWDNAIDNLDPGPATPPQAATGKPVEDGEDGVSVEAALAGVALAVILGLGGARLAEARAAADRIPGCGEEPFRNDDERFERMA